MEITFAIVSDLYSAGRTEDGSDYHAELYYIQAESETGLRWDHPAAFHGAKRHTDDEGWPHFEDIREMARRQAERLLAQIQVYHAKHGISLDKWHPAPTAYGSAAYGPQDEWDRMDDCERARFI